MRGKLAAIAGTRARFSARFERFEVHTRRGYGVERALFLDVRGTGGEELADHVWILRGKQINDMHLVPGDRIEFTATVRGYWKGYHDNRTHDYQLARQSGMRKIGAAQTTNENQYLLL